MTVDQIIFEVGKLGLQSLGAAIIAWLAVRWALARFKVEKTWERRLAAYADVISALSEMRLVLGRQSDEIEQIQKYSEKYQIELKERYGNARRQFENSVATAQLILPDETAKLLCKLDHDLETTRGSDPHEDINLIYSLIDDALVALVQHGQKSLA